MDRKIILFELNEVPFRIIDQFRRWRPGSTIAKRFHEFSQYETYCEEKTHLSPWLTWPSVYRGVTDEQHQIYNFGQDLTEVDRDFPTLWNLLAANGVKTGVFGSLHTFPLPKDLSNFAFYVPDVFAAGSECFPKNVEVFQEFNLSMSRESARNVKTSVLWKSAAKMLSRAPDLGFRMGTLADLGGQLVSERFNRWKKARRRTYQAVLSYDIFLKQLKKTKPDFTTFFTNHVASAMHRFWAAAFPDDYEDFEFTEEWVNTYCKEIDFAMTKLDDMVQRTMQFVDKNPEYELWLATSMGQAATEAKLLLTQLFPTNLERFMKALGVPDEAWETRPAMFAQANVFVKPDYLAHFRDKLERFSIAGEPLEYAESDNGFFCMWWGQANLQDQSGFLTLDGQVVSLEDFGMEFVTTDEGTGSNAYHIPQGMMLHYDPKSKPKVNGKPATRSQISTLEIAPTILKNYSAPIPEYMRSPVSIGSN